jgi:cytosine/adenosine deaminase-related metal-dependent hydrolase
MILKNQPMRKISAHMILDGRGNCYAKGILTIDPEGRILAVQDTNGILKESEEVEFFSGILVPGFVNAHCHLELSHLQHIFTEGTGLVPFLKQVVDHRVSDPDKVIRAAEKADWLMYKNGIVAVGDIANGAVAFKVKKQSKIAYHTFVEALGFSPERAVKAFEWAKDCVHIAECYGLSASIVPHSPYAVSGPLFRAIAAEALRYGSILSIHSQESKSEDDLYHSVTGEMVTHLRENLGLDTSFFMPTGESAIQSTLEYLPAGNHLLLVHNLNTNQADIDYIISVRDSVNTWFVICPGSNLYIQNRLPDIKLLLKNGLQICLGTDSLASNHQLSILEEMKIVQDAFPDITIHELTEWASWNGANALKMSEWAGSIEVGKRPGINLLTGVDLVSTKLLPGTKVKRLC